MLLFSAQSQAAAVFIQLSCHEAVPGHSSHEGTLLELIISSSALSGMLYDSAEG